MALRTIRKHTEPHKFSALSTPAVPSSLWFASDFLLGAGMVIIQPETEKIVVIYDTRNKAWFLPKGRKDVGESLEEAALREAYEESGYQVDFLPLYTPTRQPLSPIMRNTAYESPNTEPIYISAVTWGPRTNRRTQITDNGGEYLSFYYVGKLAVDAVHQEGTGMPDEKTYTTHLLSVDEAIERLRGWIEAPVVSRAWDLWRYTVGVEEELRIEREGEQSELQSQQSERVQKVIQSKFIKPEAESSSFTFAMIRRKRRRGSTSKILGIILPDHGTLGTT